MKEKKGMKTLVKDLNQLYEKEDFTDADMEKLDEIEESLDKMPKSKRKDKLLAKIKEIKDELEEAEDEEEEDEEEESEDEEEEDEEEEPEDEEEEDEEEEDEKSKKKKGKKGKKEKVKKGKKGKKGKGDVVPKGWKPSLKQYRRMASQVGVSRIGKSALEAIRDYNVKQTKKMLRALSLIAENSKRETIKVDDVEVYISIREE